MNLLGDFVGAALCNPDRIAKRGNAKNATAGSDDSSVGFSGSGMENVGIVAVGR